MGAGDYESLAIMSWLVARSVHESPSLLAAWRDCLQLMYPRFCALLFRWRENRLHLVLTGLIPDPKLHCRHRE